jgi:hypothetical protein
MKFIRTPFFCAYICIVFGRHTGLNFKKDGDYVKEKKEYVGYAPGGKQVWHRGEKVLCLVRVQEHHKRCGAETL